MENTKKIRFYPKMFAIIFVFLMVLGILCVRGRMNYSVDADYEAVPLEKCLISTSGYDVDDGQYIPNNDDPQMLVQFANDDHTSIYGFTIYFENEIDLSDAQVYFGREDATFYENDSKLFGQGRDNKLEIVSLTPFKYARIDIDCEFSVRDFGVADELQYTRMISTKWYAVVCVISFVVAFILSLIKKVQLFWAKSIGSIFNCLKKMWRNKIKLFLYAIITMLVVLLSIILENAYGIIKGQNYFNKFRALIFFAVLFIPIITWWFRKNIGKYCHIYFFIVVMLVGTIHVYASPRACGISWDDITHYGRTSNVSWGCNDSISTLDFEHIAAFSGSAMSKDGYTKAERNKWEERFSQNDKYILAYRNYDESCRYVAYIPAALGLILGRGLGLNYIDTFMFGRWINLLCYVAILSLSIKLLKTRGKILVMAIGLIPTNIFIATAYSYDWWVVSLSILGYSMFFSDVQRKIKITTKKMLFTMMIMIIAMLPKAVYFPLIFPMILLKKDKYENSKLCRVIGIFAMVILVATFIMPMLTGNGSSGDVRGGAGVDSQGQIKFILSQPFVYAGILIRFLLEYLSFDNADGYLTFMAYYGQAEFFTVCLIMLTIAAIVDNNEIIDRGEENLVVKAGAILSILGSLVLVVTALYISFTPVGYNTVNGCQPRYILPVIFATLYYLCSFRINISEKTKNKFIMLICVTMTYIFLYGIYDLCIAYF